MTSDFVQYFSTLTPQEQLRCIAAAEAVNDQIELAAEIGFMIVQNLNYGGSEAALKALNDDLLNALDVLEDPVEACEGCVNPPPIPDCVYPDDGVGRRLGVGKQFEGTYALVA